MGVRTASSLVLPMRKVVVRDIVEGPKSEAAEVCHDSARLALYSDSQQPESPSSPAATALRRVLRIDSKEGAPLEKRTSTVSQAGTLPMASVEEEEDSLDRQL